MSIFNVFNKKEDPIDHSSTLDTVDKFNDVVKEIQSTGRFGSVEVTEELFHLFTTHSPGTEYFTYGSPGVKVYKAGTREACEAKDKWSAEASHTYETKKKSGELKDEKL